LIRHGMTDDVGIRFSGRKPGVHLNEEGRKQVQLLVERLRYASVQAIYSSPLERTMETAEPIAKTMGLSVHTANEIIELDSGEWTGREIESLRNDRQFQLFNSFRSTASIPGGEWMGDVQARIVKFLQGLCEQHGNETVIVVSHGDVIKAAIVHYLGLHLDLFHRFEVAPAAVNIVEVFAETSRILMLNGGSEIN
jgi:probable phosphomutase (TIGR03848 family)